MTGTPHPDRADGSLFAPRPGEVWISRDRRDHGLRVTVERVENGRVTYRRMLRRTISVKGFLRLYRPTNTEPLS